MQLAQVEVGHVVRRVLEKEGAEPVGSLLELVFAVSLSSTFKVKRGQVQHGFFVSLTSTFLVQMERLVSISIDAESKLVATAQVIQCSVTTFIRGLLEPLNRLVMVA